MRPALLSVQRYFKTAFLHSLAECGSDFFLSPYFLIYKKVLYLSVEIKGHNKEILNMERKQIPFSANGE
jgi:hypothetical protein